MIHEQVHVHDNNIVVVELMIHKSLVRVKIAANTRVTFVQL